MADNGILHAYKINGDGSGEALSGQDISDTIKSKTLAWVHLDATEPASREWIQKEVAYLDSIILDALLADETRPRALEYNDGVLLIFRGMNLNKDAQAEDMVSIRLWVDKHRIISLQRRQLKAVNDVVDKLLTGKGPANSGDFVALLSARLFERMEPVLSDFDGVLDDIEERVMEQPDVKERQEIVDVRKKAIIFKRHISPQRDVMAFLRAADYGWLDKSHKRRLQESYDRLMRYIEDLDIKRERAQIIRDELANALADRLNKNMYVLSVIAAIFLPLGFLTGLLGINIGGIPGADNADAFFIFCGGLSVLVVLQIILFKKMKWF